MTIVDFELVVASREYGEYVFIICNYNVCVFYNKLGNCIVISNRNISVITMKVVLFFFTKCQPKHKLDQISSIPNVTPHTFHPPPPPHPPFKQKFMRCAIWYHLYNLKNVKNIHGEVSLLRKD